MDLNQKLESLEDNFQEISKERDHYLKKQAKSIEELKLFENLLENEKTEKEESEKILHKTREENRHLKEYNDNLILKLKNIEKENEKVNIMN